MVQKSRIRVTKVRDIQPSSCPLIIKGIKKQQQIDLCTGYCDNLNKIETHGNNGPVPTTGELSNYLFSKH